MFVWVILFVVQCLLMVGVAGFAFAMGGEGERRAALWWGANYILNTALGATGWQSPTVQLVLDGICATGFLPLAVLYVSWWAGAVALLSASLFSLEAAYLLEDKPIDLFYATVNNVLTVLTGVVFLVSGVTNAILRRRRRRNREPTFAGGLASAAG